ncbi:hypothetical protein QPK87_07280 [Kamptonema cortianum]|nr:hypothetical protein [Geitlerinema splendidum]MDK3156377.1 hypothetical protein [Kamptonema cortianum]
MSEEKKDRSAAVGMVALGVALGVAAFAFLARRRRDETPWDVDRVLDACDLAAAKLDEILLGEISAGQSA